MPIWHPPIMEITAIPLDFAVHATCVCINDNHCGILPHVSSKGCFIDMYAFTFLIMVVYVHVITYLNRGILKLCMHTLVKTTFALLLLS